MMRAGIALNDCRGVSLNAEKVQFGEHTAILAAGNGRFDRPAVTLAPGESEWAGRPTASPSRPNLANNDRTSLTVAPGTTVTGVPAAFTVKCSVTGS